MKSKFISLSIAILFVLLFGCSTNSTDTLFDSGNFEILFSSTQQITFPPSSYHLYKMKLDGSNEIQITNFSNGSNYTYTGEASWSPNGSKIIFTSNMNNDGGSSIYTINPDGTNLVRINHTSYGGNDPKFSPNGNKILFEVTQQNGNIMDTQLYTMNPDGTNETQITNYTNGTVSTYNGDASWSTDGSKIIFTSNMNNDGGSSIYTISPNGTNLVRINHASNGGNDPKFSPNGSKILFEVTLQNGNVMDTQLHTMNPDGTNDTQITNFSNGFSSVYNGGASWFPDGSKIIFTSNKNNDGGSGIYTINPDGSNLVRINHISRNEQDPRIR